MMRQVGWAPRCLLKPARNGWRSESDIGFKCDAFEKGVHPYVEGGVRFPLGKPELRLCQNAYGERDLFDVTTQSRPDGGQSSFFGRPRDNLPHPNRPTVSSLPRRPRRLHPEQPNRARPDHTSNSLPGWYNLDRGNTSPPNAPRVDPNFRAFEILKSAL